MAHPGRATITLAGAIMAALYTVPAATQSETGAGRGEARGTGRSSPTAGPTKGHQVFKFSPDGKQLMRDSKPGGASEPDYFDQANNGLIRPNGHMFVSERHSSGRCAKSRI